MSRGWQIGGSGARPLNCRRPSLSAQRVTVSANIRVTCTPDNLVSTSNAWGAPPGGAPPKLPLVRPLSAKAYAHGAARLPLVIYLYRSSAACAHQHLAFGERYQRDIAFSLQQHIIALNTYLRISENRILEASSKKKQHILCRSGPRICWTIS